MNEGIDYLRSQSRIYQSNAKYERKTRYWTGQPRPNLALRSLASNQIKGINFHMKHQIFRNYRKFHHSGTSVMDRSFPQNSRSDPDLHHHKSKISQLIIISQNQKARLNYSYCSLFRRVSDSQVGNAE